MKKSYLAPAIRTYGSIESLTRATGEQGITDRYIDARPGQMTDTPMQGSADICVYPHGNPDACDPFYD
jgi:hypothetical protein